jgi:hypothetical protein
MAHFNAPPAGGGLCGRQILPASAGERPILPLNEIGRYAESFDHSAS